MCIRDSVGRLASTARAYLRMPTRRTEVAFICAAGIVSPEAVTVIGPDLRHRSSHHPVTRAGIPQELDPKTMTLTTLPGCAIVGAGRLGTALTAALRAGGVPAAGPFGRGFDGGGHDVVLLCVPDARIAEAAAAITPRDGLRVGHTSGATGLSALAPHAER